jgi:hypothetical protein
MKKQEKESHAKVEKHLAVAAEINKTNSKKNSFPEVGK